MTTVTDLVHDVIDYLVTQCTSNASLGAATPPVLIIDGPTPPGEPLTQQQQLWIGFDSVSGNPEAARVAQRWPFLGASGNYREETAQITCTAQAWSGDTTPATSRAVCKALVGAVDIMLRGAPTTGGPGDSSMGGLVQWSQITGLTWSQRQDNNGYSCACVFTVEYMARLAP